MSRRLMALAVLDEDSQGNEKVIAECIRQTLAEARAADDAAVEAEKRVSEMLAIEFVNVTVVEPFKIFDALNFDRWSVRVKYSAGEPFVVNQ